MKKAKLVSALFLTLLAIACLFPSLVTPDQPEQQFRDQIDSPPSARFPLGADDLGRNRLARLLSGTRTSLLLAPIAALVSVVVAVPAGLTAAAGGSFANRLFDTGADLTGSLPWLFVLIALRAMLPLDSPAVVTTGITFGALALLGWSGPARVVRNMTVHMQVSEFAMQAEASGITRWRFSTVHLLPNVWPVAFAQFWVNIPVFVLAEANLGLLGMGISEPYASLGGLLRELEVIRPLRKSHGCLRPAVLLTAVVAAMWLIGRSGAFSEDEA